MSRRKLDMRAESELSKFMDSKFYSWMEKEYNYKVTREKNVKKQLKGVDVIIETNNDTYYVDEKAQLYYLNKELPTFAFEVDFINLRGERTEGWLLNNSLLTDYYLLIWPFANKDDISMIREDNFVKLDCLIIKKMNIQNYLLVKGWSVDRIRSKAKDIRNNGKHGKISLENESEFYFYYSEKKNYTEQPINIVIRKNVLINLSDQRYLVTKKDVEKLKEH